MRKITPEILQKILSDKNIRHEGKMIFTYLYSNSYDKLITHLYVGELQPILRIKNVALRKNLETLEKNKYLIFKEYNKGMYEIHLLGK